MSSWRRRLVTAMGAELGRARGEARFLAESTAVEAETERAKAEQAITDASRKQAQLKSIHERMLATLEARKAAAVRDGHEAALEAAGQAAPAAAGTLWSAWRPESGLGRGSAPLLRVGRIADSESMPASGPSLPPPHPPTTATALSAATSTGRAPVERGDDPGASGKFRIRSGAAVASADSSSVAGGYDNSAPTVTTISLPALASFLDRSHQ
jgi:DNA segregation ATPase FtsK/SpoIIIE, S-DNA-T family